MLKLNHAKTSDCIYFMNYVNRTEIRTFRDRVALTDFIFFFFSKFRKTTINAVQELSFGKKKKDGNRRCRNNGRLVSVPKKEYFHLQQKPRK